MTRRCFEVRVPRSREREAVQKYRWKYRWKYGRKCGWKCGRTYDS